jgi:hypothetical protein
MYVTPTEEEIFKVLQYTCHVHRHAPTPALLLIIAQRYNPDLQKRALETRESRQQEFDDFVMQLREMSKSDKPSMSARGPKS